MKTNPRVHLDSILMTSSLTYKDATALKNLMENKFDKESMNGIITILENLKDAVHPVAKKKTVKKINQSFMRPMKPSKDLAAIVGSNPMPRTQVVSKIWDYIKKNDLQDPKNKRDIICDEKLEKVMGSKRVSMFELAGIVGKNLEVVK